MRAVAVLAVVAFHASKEWFPKGYLGVDVFFVISGFLICGHIMQRIDAGTFTFRDFYVRRARRLLPATISTLIFTTLLVAVLFVPSQRSDYLWQFIGALTFTANFVLAFQADYFAAASEMKPLLHTWSLSLEEQFYFAAPLAIWLTPARHRLKLFVGAGILSGIVCLVLMAEVVKGGSVLAFFMLPARAWELLIGAMAAYAVRNGQWELPVWFRWAALAAIVAINAVGISEIHPGPDAMIVCALTAIILLGRDNWLPSGMGTDAAVKIGDWSYSIYLVHWPLFALAFVTYVGEPPTGIMLGLAAAAIILGWLQYRFVERPFIEKRAGWAVPSALASSLALAMVVFLPLDKPDASKAEQFGLARACAQSEYVDLPECRMGTPEVLLWGDSHAMQLVAGLKDVPFRQATKFACAPVLEAAQNNGQKYDSAWARECIAFNDAVMKTAIEPTVILASDWRQLFEQTHPVDGDPYEGLVTLISGLEERGSKVVLVGPIPASEIDVGRCSERLIEGKLTLRSCELSAQMAKLSMTGTIAMLERVEAETGASVLWPHRALCDAIACQTSYAGKSLYADRAHLTAFGAQYLVAKIGLSEQLKRAPRKRI